MPAVAPTQRHPTCCARCAQHTDLQKTSAETCAGAGPSANVTIYGQNEFTVMQHDVSSGHPWMRGTPVHTRMQPLLQALTERLTAGDGSQNAGAASSEGSGDTSRGNSAERDTPSSSSGEGVATGAAQPADAQAPSCAVCYDALRDGVWSLRCGHVLHAPCLLTACRRRLECPLCRKRIRAADDVRRLYMT